MDEKKDKKDNRFGGLRWPIEDVEIVRESVMNAGGWADVIRGILEEKRVWNKRAPWGTGLEKNVFAMRMSQEEWKRIVKWGKRRGGITAGLKEEVMKWIRIRKNDNKEVKK